MQRTPALICLVASFCVFSSCGERIKKCTSSKRYNPGVRLEARVPESTNVQVITVPPDGIVTIEIPSDQDCTAVSLTPLLEPANQ